MQLAVIGDINALQIFTAAAAQVMPPEDAVAIPAGWTFPHTCVI